MAGDNWPKRTNEASKAGHRSVRKSNQSADPISISKKADARMPREAERLKFLLRDNTDDYPLALVASLAVQLDEPDPTRAARRAFQLLEACEEVATERWAMAKEAEWQRADAMMPFADAVRKITGNRDLEHATGKYRAVLKRAGFGGLFSDDIEPSNGKDDDKIVDEIIQRQRQVGIPEVLVFSLAIYLKLTKVKPERPPARDAAPKRNLKKVLGRH